MTRSAALDPGSGSLGLVCADGNYVPLTYVDSLPIRVAEDGRKVSPHEEAVAAHAALQWLTDHAVTHLVIERGRYYSPDGLSQAAQTSMAEAYAVTRTVAGNVALLAAMHGITVEYVSRQAWAHRLCGWWAGVTGEPRPQYPRDADIARAIPVAFTGWPAHTSTHERDAAGALAWSVLPEPTKTKRARAARATGVRKAGAEASPSYEEKVAGQRAKARERRLLRDALRLPMLSVATYTPRGVERVPCPRCGRARPLRDDGEIEAHAVSSQPDAAQCGALVTVEMAPLDAVAREIDALVAAGDLAAMVAWCERNPSRRTRGVDRGRLFRAMSEARERAA